MSPREAFWEMDGIKGTFMDAVRAALDTANMWWRVPASTEVDDILNVQVSAYISGQQDLETTVANMDAGIRQALENNPVEEGIVNFNH
jgi:ABC-type glycerol-3-phosphate transport system substrate-binding protein